jgi:thioredoxin-like negative regulator of GroEL
MKNKRKSPATIRALCAAMVVFMAVAGGEALAQAYVPASDDVVLERLPAPGEKTLRALRDLRAKLKAQPENLTLALRLARRYMDLGRSESDPRYYGYAESALKPWWDLDKPPVEVLTLRAGLYQFRHAFETALEDLSSILAKRPAHAQALLTQAFVLQVRGRNVEAMQSCRRLPKSVPRLIVATCVGRVESLTGQAATGKDLLTQAIAKAGKKQDRLRLWALTNLAEIAARTGDNQDAEQRFLEALDLGRRDVYLLGAYADFLLEQGRTREARDLLDGDTRADALLLRLAIAEDRLGREVAAEYRATLEARFEASRRRGSILHRREEARFKLEILKQSESALRLAVANWGLQKEPQDAALVLRAAIAAKAPERAAPIVKWVEKSGLEDVSIDALIQRLKKG